MPFERMSGILLHPTSLPSPFGIGDLGAGARQFLEFMVRSGQRLWQILPLGPTGYGHSPYMSYSAIAGNPLLLSPEILAEAGWLRTSDWESRPEWPLIQAQFLGQVDFETVIPFKMALLTLAADRFLAKPSVQAEFAAFCAEQAAWLDDYALFMALLEHHAEAHWSTWPDTAAGSLAKRDPQALAVASSEHAIAIARHKVWQFWFMGQWQALKAFAATQEILIIGDIPIYVAYNSADAWANPEIFYLEPDGKAIYVAGVPPDYFSKTGQLWGNPLYKWDVLKETGYRWWIKRFRFLLQYVDGVRVDHFRAFESFWAVAGDAETAIHGEWLPGPGVDFFRVLKQELGEIPILAEDLGIITPEVDALRDACEFPGMRILQFAFGDTAKNPYLPHNYVRNCAVYTGTHDNDTTVGWIYGDSIDLDNQRGYGASDAEKDAVQRYLGVISPAGVHWDLIRLAMASIADLAIFPLQDIFGLNRDARMNFPSTTQQNWSWRYSSDMLTPALTERLAELTLTYDRMTTEQLQSRQHRTAAGGTAALNRE